MMENSINLFGTIVTAVSLLSNFVTYIPRFFKWLTDKRYLYTVLGSKNKRFLITQSLFGPGMISTDFVENYRLITENSSIAIQKIAKLLEKARFKYDVFRTDKEQYDAIHIGGPISNVNTNAYINQFFPNFYFVDQTRKLQQHEDFYNIHRSVINYSDNFMGFVIKNQTGTQTETILFPVDKETDYIFLIKLTSRDLGCDQTVHLLFGGSDVGTLVATDFFTKNYKQLYKQVKNKNMHYFLALPIHKTNQSPKASEIKNLTSQMFNHSTLIVHE